MRMKKILIPAVALLTFGISHGQQLRFGAKAGVNVATITGDLEGNKALTGFHIGAIAEIKINEKFAVQPEMLYSSQGSKSRYTEGNSISYLSIDYTHTLSYLNIPIIAKYYVAPKLSLETGPQVGFLLSAKEKNETTLALADGSFQYESDKYDIKEGLKSIDFGFNIGAGYDFTPTIFAQLRYNFGLSNISDNNTTLRNSVLQASIGYKF